MDHLNIILGEVRSFTFWRDVFAEMVATGMLTASMCALPLQFVDSPEQMDLGIVAKVSIGMGFIVCCMVEVFGDMGGAHMNPAVSISFAAAYKISAFRGLMYVAAQCIGATGGAGFVYAVTPPEYRGTLSVTSVHPHLAPWKAMFVEIWLTAVLVFTVWGATNRKRRDTFMPSIPIGFAVAVCLMAGANHTGPSINPARSLGPAIVMGEFKDHWVYWVGPILGGLLATFMYRVVFNRVDNFHSISPTEIEDDRHRRFVDAVKDVMDGNKEIRIKSDSVYVVDIDYDNEEDNNNSNTNNNRRASRDSATPLGITYNNVNRRSSECDNTESNGHIHTIELESEFNNFNVFDQNGKLNHLSDTKRTYF